nr:hypothetical protein [Nocardia australiensis]
MRCSTDEEDVEIQTEQLLALGVPTERIFIDRASSRNCLSQRARRSTAASTTRRRRQPRRPRRRIQRRPLHHSPHHQRSHPTGLTSGLMYQVTRFLPAPPTRAINRTIPGGGIDTHCGAVKTVATQRFTCSQ